MKNKPNCYEVTYINFSTINATTKIFQNINDIQRIEFNRIDEIRPVYIEKGDPLDQLERYAIMHNIPSKIIKT